MLVKDALNTLGIKEEVVTEEHIKEAYRKAAKKYHPDINLAGEQMMKLINLAKDSLLAEELPINSRETGQTKFNYGEEINKALNAIVDLQGISIEVCGAWVWVSGDTKPHWEKMKEAGFRYASKKKQVFFRPKDFKGRSRGNVWSMDQIRDKYGSQGVKTRRPHQLAGHRA